MALKERALLLRRGYRAGYHAALRKCRAELDAMAANFDAELASLQDEFREIGEIAGEVRRELYRDRVNHAIQQAASERATIPDEWLH
jgi:flagellar biosynthesis/type III secretory pathway protein FliH